ncbi:hypothetical protein BS47DRAFT_411320 [Hydnum rufescens UP504]|uniref:Uncharacterized protein n=1 Tax=Hydnum rufescens UP504 TaxID=1448309 RepID=A0A9P6BB54_9AGAM|nr:hypothetical protein BS47DRAFT_411320 [Hydnum rufescens UP504]
MPPGHIPTEGVAIKILIPCAFFTVDHYGTSSIWVPSALFRRHWANTHTGRRRHVFPYCSSNASKLPPECKTKPRRLLVAGAPHVSSATNLGETPSLNFAPSGSAMTDKHSDMQLPAPQSPHIHFRFLPYSP